MAERLKISDWGEFEKLYKETFSGPPPGPTDAVVVVEKKDDRIVAFGVLAMYPVFENFWVEPKFRGKGTLQRMVASVLDCFPHLSHCFAFTEKERLVTLFEHFGMEHMEGVKVLRWLRR